MAATAGKAARATRHRRLALAVIVAGLLGLPVARADQTDARLPDLFDRLKSAPTAAAAQPIEAEIWSIWLESGDDDVNALLAAGVLAMNGADYDGALAAFTRVVARAPKFAEGWNKRATVLYLMGRFTESIADIGHVLALEPRHFGALSGLGLCDVQLDRDQAALEAFQRAAAVDPNLPGVTSNIEALKRRIANHSIAL
jgi:tetratricopeptide (TPR) repeat protein